MTRFSVVLLFHHFLLLLALSNGCSCARHNFTRAYSYSETVVKARVLSSFDKSKLKMVFRFRRIRTYKGCKLSKIFFGEVKTYSSCRVYFKRRKVYMLNLDVGKGSKKNPLRLNVCQDHRLFGSLSKKERRFLVESSRKDTNKCMK